MKGISLTIAILIVTLIACDSETELRRSIFISDKDNPGLPEYSEWGYNTFGVYYDRAPFVSSDYETPAKFITNDESTLFSLQGNLIAYDPMSLSFSLRDFTPATFSDLVSLHNTTFDLTSTNVTLSHREFNGQIDILDGTLIFNRAQTLIVDGKLVEVILSGHFEFKALVNGGPVTFSEGRFDLGIGPESFYGVN